MTGGVFAETSLLGLDLRAEYSRVGKYYDFGSITASLPVTDNMKVSVSYNTINDRAGAINDALFDDNFGIRLSYSL